MRVVVGSRGLVTVKIWLNGHEYAKRAAAVAGIGFTELDNGFASTDDPAGLQRVCDMLTPGVIRVFCERCGYRCR
jgi:hypothetical protein